MLVALKRELASTRRRRRARRAAVTSTAAIALLSAAIAGALIHRPTSRPVAISSSMIHGVKLVANDPDIVARWSVHPSASALVPIVIARDRARFEPIDDDELFAILSEALSSFALLRTPEGIRIIELEPAGPRPLADSPEL